MEKQLLQEIIEDLESIYNTRKNRRESSADIVQISNKYKQKLQELGRDTNVPAKELEDTNG